MDGVLELAFQGRFELFLADEVVILDTEFGGSQMQSFLPGYDGGRRLILPLGDQGHQVAMGFLVAVFQSLAAYPIGVSVLTEVVVPAVVVPAVVVPAVVVPAVVVPAVPVVGGGAAGEDVASTVAVTHNINDLKAIDGPER